MSPRATDFADWVFQRTNPGYRRPEPSEFGMPLLRLGKMDHERISQFFATSRGRSNLSDSNSNNWTLVFADDQGDENSKTFDASRLSVKGQFLRCKPDCVLKHKSTGEIIIIERKTTFIPNERIPDSGWPNVEAQLWCYSWVDDWYYAPRVTLVQQYWIRQKRSGLSLHHNQPVLLRNDQAHERRCADWFRAYGGEVSIGCSGQK